jgi:hypothetical protein
MYMKNSNPTYSVNVFHNSTWCLFNTLDIPDEDVVIDDDKIEKDQGIDGLDEAERQKERKEKKKYKPYKFSCKSYSFDKNSEKIIIDKIRIWASNYFSTHPVITSSMYKLLSEV